MRLKPAASGLLALAVLALASAVRADDAPRDSSPAAKAYEEAFWQETGTGALDRALEGYRSALAAEGPEAVRARALYRSAVVLHRMGRTEEAVKALEGLAKSFPGERDLLAEAKARLEDWTAVDLRTSFEEWYRRHRYSPEFQAKVLDLVLALGSPSDEPRLAAREQLLTIGDAAIPALRAHLDSANLKLRGEAVAILLRLGEVPDPRHLLQTAAYASDSRAWRTIQRAAPEIREGIARAATGDSALHQMLRAVAGGRDAMLALLRSPWGGWPVDPLVDLLVPEARSDPALLDALEAIVLDPDLPFPAAPDDVARGIVGSLPPERVLAWASRGSRDLARWLNEIVDEGNVRSPEGWRVLLAALQEKPDLPVLAGLLRLVEDAVPPADPDPVVAAMLAGGAKGDWVVGPRTAEVVRRVARASEAEGQATAAFSSWWRKWRAEDGAEGLLDLVRNAKLPSVRGLAAEKLVRALDGRSLEPAWDLLREADPPVAEGVVRGLLAFQDLVLDVPTTALRRLRDLAGDPPANWFWPLLDRLERIEGGDAALVAHVLADPLSVPPGYFQRRSNRGFPLRPSAEQLAALRAAWANHPPEVRRALLVGLLGYGPLRWEPGPRSEDPASIDFVRFLRGRLAVLNEAREVKLAILDRFKPAGLLRLADLTAVHDVNREEGARWLLDALPALAQEPGAYDATAFLRSSADEKIRLATYDPFLRLGHARAAQDACEDPAPAIRVRGLEALSLRRSQEDVPRFQAALKDPEASVRARAAAALSTVWSGPAIDDLVRTLNDPDGGVRDAVLAALDRIARVESFRRAWTLYMSGQAPMPPGLLPEGAGAPGGERPPPR